MNPSQVFRLLARQEIAGSRVGDFRAPPYLSMRAPLERRYPRNVLADD